MNMKSILKHFDRIEASSITDAKTAKRVAKLQAKRKQGGFTLLELLVVVAILAAIAGTATIALQDTDARASAAAHVAMMDELNEGIRTYRVLNKNTYPTNFDSLIETTSNDTSFTGAALIDIAALEDLQAVTLTVDAAERMSDIGINGLMVAHNDAGSNPDGDGDCSDFAGLIASRGNAVVAGNIFLTPAANGCGYQWQNIDSDDTTDGFQLNGTPSVMIWNGGYERILGFDGIAMDAQMTADADGNYTTFTADADDDTADPIVLMAVGLGPSSNLFNANELGGLTSVPVYRHVSETEYNRFIALFNIGTFVTGGITYTPADQVTLVTIIDGAGDTKEEELGEWDGTRNTI